MAGRHTPHVIRNEAVRDLLKACQSCFAKAGRSTMKCKSKKATLDGIVIHNKHYDHKRWPYSMIREVKSAETLPENIDYDSKLVKNENSNLIKESKMKFEEKKKRRSEVKTTGEKHYVMDVHDVRDLKKQKEEFGEQQHDENKENSRRKVSEMA